MALITCQNLTLGYEGKPIVEKLNFSIREKNYFCIVGENGSGKSTLMRTLLGLQQPLGGKIEFGDGLKQNEIGYLPQQTLVQRDFPASVREIVLSGCQGHCGIRPFYGKKEKEMAHSAMEKMDIVPLAARCYRELSGGQQQRVLLARALCAARKVILLDEPVSGLDPKVTAEMYRLIEELNRKDGITIIMISHDMTAALTCATHILHVGQTWFCGTKEEYLQSDVGKMYASFYADNISAVSGSELAAEKSGGKNSGRKDSSGRSSASEKMSVSTGAATGKSGEKNSQGKTSSRKKSSAGRRK